METYRDCAAREIRRIDRDLPAAASFRETKRALRDGYPFGERLGWAYRAWLIERRRYLMRRFPDRYPDVGPKSAKTVPRSAVQIPLSEGEEVVTGSIADSRRRFFTPATHAEERIGDQLRVTCFGCGDTELLARDGRRCVGYVSWMRQHVPCRQEAREVNFATENAVSVTAFTIVSVGSPDKLGARWIATDDFQTVNATADMFARYVPVAGDYWVVQEDGYTYINPKAVFERKYAPTRPLPTSVQALYWCGEVTTDSSGGERIKM